ncbi:MAG: ribonucleoside-triphosphate reductase [Atribacterota bacterium]|nr:ribonucleoside-triphosphate reductase [Atribacterota bacterium]
MSLKETLMELGKGFPAEFKEQKDGSLVLQFVIAERKAFLSKKKLTYKSKVRVNDEKKEVTFFEMLSESNSGLSAGSGFEFKKETYGVKGKEREGGIEEMSNLFGKNYQYSFDYKKIREAIKKEAQKTGYSFSVKLIEKLV